MTWWVNVNEGIHTNIDQPGFAKQTRQLAPDQRIDSIPRGVRLQQFDKGGPGTRWRIAHVAHIVGFMEGNPPSRSHECRRFGDDLLRLRHIDQDETRRREIKGCPGQPSGSSITLHHLDIPEVALRNERSGEGDSLRAPLDSHDAPRRANPLGEEIETTVRPAADLDDARAAGDRYLIKQPARFMRELLRLLLQPRLLRLPVAKHVLVGLGHDESSHRSRAAELTVDQALRLRYRPQCSTFRPEATRRKQDAPLP